MVWEKQVAKFVKLRTLQQVLNFDVWKHLVYHVRKCERRKGEGQTKKIIFRHCWLFCLFF